MHQALSSVPEISVSRTGTEFCMQKAHSLLVESKKAVKQKESYSSTL